MGEVETNCGETIQKERHKDDEWINILKDISENNDHDHDGDGNDGYQEGDGEPTNPVEPVREAHHFCQLLHSRLLLLYNPLEQIVVIVCYFISIEELFDKFLFTFKTSGTVKAKEKIVQMGVRNSCMTWKMSRSCKLPFRE